MKNLLFFAFLLYFIHPCGAQQNIDSLKNIINTTTSDTVKIKIYIALSAVSEGDDKRRYLDQAMKWARKINDVVSIGDIYEKIGDLFYPYEIDSAGYYFELSLETYKFSFHNKENVAKALNTMGTVFWYKNSLAEAADYYIRALEINTQIGNVRNYAINCLNLSMIYSQLEEYEKALVYSEKMDAVDLSQMDDAFMHAANNTKGILLMKLDRLEESKAVHSENVALAERIGDSYQIGMSLENLGLVYTELGLPDSALIFLYDALDHSEYRQEFEFMALYNNIAVAYYDLKNYKKSLASYETALEYSTKSDYTPWLLATYKGLSDVNHAMRNFEESILYLEKYIAAKDSMISEENKAAFIELETKYKAKEKQQEIELLTKNQQLGEIELKNKSIIIAKKDQAQLFLVIGGLILIALIIVVLAAFFAKQKSNRQLKLQKAEIEEKNTEIIDSLNYAKRLQAAILPPASRFEKCFDSYFVLYLPKSIVSGDFYWLEETNGKTHLAVADCTGHGVPGALVSVVCSNTLSRVIFEKEPKNPGDMLDKSRDMITEYFSHNEGNINDGMDISLVTIQQYEKRTLLEYAGANNPLWLVRNGELTELKADKQPIGRFASGESFKTHSLDLQKGDTLYLFSDGFQDQFGGEKEKKFKAASLKKELLNMQHKPMHEQQNMLRQILNNWKGKLEQVDDICVLGVRI